LLSGIVTLSDLQRVYDTDEDKHLTVGDICVRNVITVTPDEVLWKAIQIMNTNDIGRVPVVKRGTREIVGIIRRRSIMRAYSTAVTRKLEDQHMAERIRLNTLTGAHVLEIYIERNAPIVGKRIADVNWPDESVVAAIRRGRTLVVPHGTTELRAGDSLTIVAEVSAKHALDALIRPEKSDNNV
jgi:CBS domain-containing protein